MRKPNEPLADTSAASKLRYRETPKVPSIRFHEGSGYSRGPSLVQCFAKSAGDLRRLLVTVELHDPLEALRAGDENTHAAAEGISRDPGLVGNRQVVLRSQLPFRLAVPSPPGDFAVATV